MIRPILSGYYWNPISNLLQEFNVIEKNKKKIKQKSQVNGYVCYCADISSGTSLPSTDNRRMFGQWSIYNSSNENLISSAAISTDFMLKSFKTDKSKAFSMGTRAVQHNEEIKSFINGSLLNVQNCWRGVSSFVIPGIDGRHPAVTINCDRRKELQDYIQSLLEQLS